MIEPQLEEHAAVSTLAAPKLELRICDCGADDTRIELVVGGARRTLQTRFTPPSAARVQARERYFAAPSTAHAPEDDPRRVAEHAMLSLGRALGESLCDEQYALVEFADRVEAAGIQNLEVAIESNRPEFHALPWELFILPDSPYFAAAASGRFVRMVSRKTGSVEPSACAQLDHGSERPLRLLRLVSRVGRAAGTDHKPSAVAWQTELLRFGGALQPELLVNAEHAALRERLAAAGEATPYRVVHFDGPARIVAGQLHFELGNRQPELIADRQFYETLAAAGVELLILDLGVERLDGHTLSASALSGLRAGLGNLLLLDMPLDALHADSCWAEVYSHIARGSGLHCAVVEARKALQRAFIERAGAAHPGQPALQSWSALQHYSQRDLRCFEVAPAQQQIEDVQALAHCRARMLGFRAHHTSSGGAASDSGTLALLGFLSHGLGTEVRPVLLCGAPGFGATQALHRCAQSLLLDRWIAHALYWNFEDECYTATDIREMASTALQPSKGPSATLSEVADALAAQRYLCVFENLECSHADEAAERQLLDLFARLARAQVRCVIGVRTERSLERLRELFGSERTFELRLQPLAEPAALALAHALGAAEHAAAIVRCGAGNAFLVRKLAELSACEGAPLDAPELRALPPNDAVAAFWVWRWSVLPSVWRPLLLTLTRLGDAYLEMWALAFDNCAADGGGRRLWARLGLPADQGFKQAFAAIERSGFTVKRSSGTVIDSAARGFLRACSATEPRLCDPDTCSALDELVCESVGRLAAHQRARPYWPVIDNLLANRGLWWQHVEAAFAAKRYAIAANTLLHLEPLLSRAQLGAELPAIAYSLLERSALADVGALDATQALAWFAVADRCLANPKYATSEVVRQSAGVWLRRIQDEAWRGAAEGALFDTTVAFLRKAYDHASDYASYRALCAIASDHYALRGDARKQLWSRLALAACAFELGESDEGDRIEAELLAHVLRDELAAEDRARLRHGLAGARLRRGNVAGCREILEAAGDLADPGDRLLMAELELAERAPELAMHRLCTLWSDALAQRNLAEVERSMALMQRVARELGEERFQELYAQWVPSGPDPRAVGLLPAVASR